MDTPNTGQERPAERDDRPPPGRRPPRPLVQTGAPAVAVRETPVVPESAAGSAKVAIDRRAVLLGGGVLLVALLLGVGVLLRGESAKPAASSPAADVTAASGDSGAVVDEAATTDDSGGVAEETPTTDDSVVPPDDDPVVAEEQGRLVETPAYRVTVPVGWVRDANEKDHDGVYAESRWHEPGSPDVYLLVDHSAGFDGTAASGARGVRDQLRRSSQYGELSFGAVSLGGRDAWRWEFTLGDARKVDYFTTGCDTGFALLGAAPRDRYEDYVEDFRTAARSLEPTC
jgi:hypothetical protein